MDGPSVTWALPGAPPDAAGEARGAMAVLFMERIVGRTPWPIHHAKFN
jgi:hypothetical protein